MWVESRVLGGPLEGVPEGGREREREGDRKRGKERGRCLDDVSRPCTFAGDFSRFCLEREGE